MFQRISIAVIFLVSVLNSLAAENYTVTSEMQWTEQQWILSITYPLQNTERVLPALKKQAEDAVSDDLKDRIFNQLQSVMVDSRTTVKDFIQEHPASIHSIYDLSDKAHRRFSLLSKDMKDVKIQYTIDLYPDIAGIFIQHTQPSVIEPLLKFVPSTDFSGIVIYVKELLPLFGKNRKGTFTPSLFPRIYDDSMHLIVTKSNVAPENIKKWGETGFNTDLTIRTAAKRVGLHPLKIAATGLFGIHNTDIIIPVSEAAKILAKKNNINLVYKGRILVIYERGNNEKFQK